MGRFKKPAKRQLSEGDPRKVGRHKLEAEAASRPVPSGLPSPPETLSARAKQVFEHAVSELDAMGIIGKADEMMLVTMAVSYVGAEEAREEAECLREGPQDAQTRAAIQRADKREDRKLALFLKTADKLGLSPAAREHLSIESDPDDAHAQLMKILSEPRKPRTPIEQTPTSEERKPQ
ncbi:MAG TPA: P27 family phage terminase small subunit [Terriglobales bacterium]|nr:P27 family phage terminase small subunit [Terriglobales bacterium]